MPTMRHFFASAFMLSVGCAAGCGSADPFHYVKVSGRVTYEDGSPIPANILRLTFIPQASAVDSKTHPLAGRALVGADGVFESVTSHKPGDGLVPGKHTVTVIALDDQERPTAAVPSDYADPDQTPLEVDTANRPFTLLVKKPQLRTIDSAEDGNRRGAPTMRTPSDAATNPDVDRDDPGDVVVVEASGHIGGMTTGGPSSTDVGKACVSASHAASVSLRMEPVYMALGQAPGTAAAFVVAAVPARRLRIHFAGRLSSELLGPAGIGLAAINSAASRKRRMEV